MKLKGLHCQAPSKLDDPDGTEGYCDDADDAVDELDHGAVDGPAAGALPFAIAFPGEVVEGEGGAAHLVQLLLYMYNT